MRGRDCTAAFLMAPPDERSASVLRTECGIAWHFSKWLTGGQSVASQSVRLEKNCSARRIQVRPGFWPETDGRAMIKMTGKNDADQGAGRRGASMERRHPESDGGRMGIQPDLASRAYWPGENPKQRTKQRVMWLWSAKPQASAASASGMPWAMNCRTCWMRRCTR